MTQKTKAIIIVVVAIILFALLIATIFDLFPSKEDAPQISDEPEIILPDRDEGMPTGAVFDSSNTQEFSDLNPIFFDDSGQSSLEKEAEDLAQFFIERFGTYSSDADFANIDDLLGFMTSDMQNSMENYKRNQPVRSEYYAITTDISSIKTKSFSLTSRTASFDIITNREEELGSIDIYQQQAQIDLKQDSTGQWKVDSVLWGNRL